MDSAKIESINHEDDPTPLVSPQLEGSDGECKDDGIYAQLPLAHSHSNQLTPVEESEDVNDIFCSLDGVDAQLSKCSLSDSIGDDEHSSVDSMGVRGRGFNPDLMLKLRRSRRPSNRSTQEEQDWTGSSAPNRQCISSPDIFAPPSNRTQRTRCSVPVLSSANFYCPEPLGLSAGRARSLSSQEPPPPPLELPTRFTRASALSSLRKSASRQVRKVSRSTSQTSEQILGFTKSSVASISSATSQSVAGEQPADSKPLSGGGDSSGSNGKVPLTTKSMSLLPRQLRSNSTQRTSTWVPESLADGDSPERSGDGSNSGDESQPYDTLYASFTMDSMGDGFHNPAAAWIHEQKGGEVLSSSLDSPSYCSVSSDGGSSYVAIPLGLHLTRMRQFAEEQAERG